MVYMVCSFHMICTVELFINEGLCGEMLELVNKFRTDIEHFFKPQIRLIYQKVKINHFYHTDEERNFILQNR